MKFPKTTLIEIVVNFQTMKASLVGAIDGFAKEFGIEAIEFA